jgi:hypothetical protein
MSIGMAFDVHAISTLLRPGQTVNPPCAIAPPALGYQQLATPIEPPPSAEPRQGSFLCGAAIVIGAWLTEDEDGMRISTPASPIASRDLRWAAAEGWLCALGQTRGGWLIGLNQCNDSEAAEQLAGCAFIPS